MPIVVDYPTFQSQLAGAVGLRVFYRTDGSGGFTAVATGSSLGAPLVYQGDMPETFALDFPGAVKAQGLSI